MSELHMGLNQALYEVPASLLMVMLNQSVLQNMGSEKMMTLADMEIIDGRN
jgi:hypothetical protein